MTSATPLLQVTNLAKHYAIGRSSLLSSRQRLVHAVDGVSFDIASAETLSLVGESGCGKTTVGRLVLRLIEPTRGEIRLRGDRIDKFRRRELAAMRQQVQVVFQDPFGSLNPRLKVSEIIAEPLVNFRLATSSAAIDKRVSELLDQVGLPRDAGKRYPHEFSGGQRQRICIARALSPAPALIVCDEPVSALDVSVKAQIINLLRDLQQDLRLSLLFISHDLAIVEHLTHRVAVMYLGKIVEIAEKGELFATPNHPYTQALLSAIPRLDPDVQPARIPMTGEIPSPVDPPGGCRFHTRCPYAVDRCRLEEPNLRLIEGSRAVACHFVKPLDRT